MPKILYNRVGNKKMKKMKKSTLFLIASFVFMLCSCVKPSEKLSGNYSGNSTSTAVEPCTVSIVASGDAKVNFTMTYTNISFYSSLIGLPVSMSGENVVFSYAGATTAEGVITYLNGTLSGNTLNFSWTIYFSTGSLSGTFSGTK